VSDDRKDKDTELRAAELARIRAETKKLEAQREKIQLEGKELAKKFNLPLYRTKVLYQAIVAGIVAVPLIWFYVKDIAIPLFNKENIELSWRKSETSSSGSLLRNSIVSLRKLGSLLSSAPSTNVMNSCC